jgi:hypothetical protein
VCKSCGKETVVIGYEESSQLDVEPAKYFVLVTKREKRACRSCEDLGVVSAPLPPRIIEKCLASDRIVIDTVIDKYCNHTPLHRQSMILERDLGLALSRATLDGWVLKVGELALRTCTVSCEDSDGHQHSLEVTAETLYEALAKALAAFKRHEWVGQIGRGHTITVRVQQPAVEHRVRILEFEKWLETNGKSPAEMMLKSRLRSILGRP